MKPYPRPPNLVWYQLYAYARRCCRLANIYESRLCSNSRYLALAIGVRVHAIERATTYADFFHRYALSALTTEATQLLKTTKAMTLAEGMICAQLNEALMLVSATKDTLQSIRQQVSYSHKSPHCVLPALNWRAQLKEKLPDEPLSKQESRDIPLIPCAFEEVSDLIHQLWSYHSTLDAALKDWHALKPT